MTNTPALVSIALATYNGLRYLPELLASLDAQTWPNIEVVVSDDGSADGTLEWLHNWRGTVRLRVLQPRERLGIVGNFAKAIAECRGQYIALADQDDVWSVDKVADLVRALEAVESLRGRRTPALAFCDIEVVDARLSSILKSFFDHNAKSQRASRLRDFLLSNHIPGCAMLLNRAAVELSTPFPDGIAMHDWWLAMVVAAFGKIVYVDAPHLKYRQHDSNAVGVSVPNSAQNAQAAARQPDAARTRKQSRLRHLTSVARQSQLFATRFAGELPLLARHDLRAFYRGTASLPHAVWFVLTSRTGESYWCGLKMLRRMRRLALPASRRAPGQHELGSRGASE